MKSKEYIEKKIREYWKAEKRWNIFFAISLGIGAIITLIVLGIFIFQIIEWGRAI